MTLSIRRTALPLAAVVALATVVGIAVFGGSSGATRLPDRLNISQLSCPIHGPGAAEGTGQVFTEEAHYDSGEVPKDTHATRPTVPVSKRRASPSEALPDYLALVERNHPNLRSSDFAKVGENDGLADFVLEEDGHVVQRVRFQRLDPEGHWVPLGMVGCQE